MYRGRVVLDQLGRVFPCQHVGSATCLPQQVRKELRVRVQTPSLLSEGTKCSVAVACYTRGNPLLGYEVRHKQAYEHRPLLQIVVASTFLVVGVCPLSDKMRF